jgi:hypothetical protein
MVLIAVAALLLIAAIAEAASASDFTSCGDPSGTSGSITNLQAKGTGCATAGKLARRFAHHPDSGLLGFHCRQTAGGNAGPVRCSRNGGEQVVKFHQFGLL